MHMADALLSPAVGGGFYAASVAAIAYSAKKIKKDEPGESKAPLMAVSGAMVFAAQMVNFTIPGTGSSGHIGGGVLLAALLGPFAGMLALAAVLVIQCLCFADGGLLALGCNIFNIAVIPCLFVYPFIMRPILSPSPTTKRIWVGSLTAAVVALQLGSFGVVAQTTASGIIELPFTVFALFMQPIHLVIGVVEGIVTAAILNFVFAARPELLTSHLIPAARAFNTATDIRLTDDAAGPANSADGRTLKPLKTIIIVFACIAIVTAAGLSLLASKNPDGLEWSITKTAGTDELQASGGIPGFFSSVQEKLSFMQDYGSAAGDGRGAPVAGIIGAALVFALAGAAGLIIHIYKKRRKNAGKPYP